MNLEFAERTINLQECRYDVSRGDYQFPCGINLRRETLEAFPDFMVEMFTDIHRIHHRDHASYKGAWRIRMVWDGPDGMYMYCEHMRGDGVFVKAW